MRRRALLVTAGAGMVGGCTIGGDPPEGDDLTLRAPEFDDGIPERFTCDGAGDSPPLVVEGIPEGTESVAIVGEWLQQHDPAAGPSTIWLLWNLPAEDPLELPPGIPDEERPPTPDGAIQGRNDEGWVGYRSPCHETPDDNEYRFAVLALESTPDIEPGAGRDVFDDAVEPAVLSSISLHATYNRF